MEIVGKVLLEAEGVRYQLGIRTGQDQTEKNQNGEGRFFHMDLLVLKIKDGGVLRRLTLPKGDGVVLSYVQLLTRTRDFFRLPATSLAAFAYVDEDVDDMVLAGDRDLEDALVLQGLNPLRLTMKVGAPEAVSRVARNEPEQSEKKDSAKAPEKARTPTPFAFGT